MQVKMPGIKRYRHPKTGVEYVYHRKTGIRLSAPIGSSAFVAEYADAERKLRANLPPKPGTLGLLMKAYRASTFFTRLKRRTRSDYDKVMDYLADVDELPLVDCDRPFVAQLRDKIATQRGQRFTNYCLAVLSVVMEFGKDAGNVTENPVRGVRRVPRLDGGPVNRPWTKAERDTVMAALPLHLLLPVAIGRWTGLREGDVLSMPRAAYDGQRITLTTAKRDVPGIWPVAEPLKAIIDKALAEWPTDCPKTITLCASSRRRPWTESGFRSSFFKIIRRLTAEGAIGYGVTFHGLRHTVATELAELGFDDRTIADMLAQESEKMPAHYSRTARLEKKLRGVVRKMVRADKAGTKVSTRRTAGVYTPKR